MPNVKISAASDAGTLLATDMLPLARSGDTNAYHATMAEVGTYIGASPGNVFANQATFQAGLLLNNNQYIDWMDNAGTAQPVIALDNSNNLVLRSHGAEVAIENAGGTVVATVDSSGNVSANGNVSASGNISTAGGSVAGAYLSSSGNANVSGTLTTGGVTNNGNETVAGTLSVGSSGITYPGVAAGIHHIAFSWTAANPALNVYVDGGAQGQAVISQGGSGYTAVFELQLNGTGPSMAAWYTATNAVTWPCTFSDRRLKTNVRAPSVDALDIINRLAVHECDLTPPFEDAATQHWECALIADEVADVVPNAYVAAPERDGVKGYETLRELPLIATLWRAVQQLSAEVAQLKAR